MKKLLLAALVLFAPAVAVAQTGPNWPLHYVPSPAEWQAMWVSKQDTITFGTGARAALGQPVSGTGAICLTVGSACGGLGSLTVGTTTISGGTPGNIEYNNAGTLGELTPAQTRTLLGLAPVATSGSATDLTAGTLPAARLPAFGSGDVSFASGGGAGTIGANAVTDAKAAQMAAHTIKGNNTAGTANAADLTATQATAELNAFVGDSGSGGTKGLVPAPATGDAAAGKFLKADGTFAVPAGGGSGCAPGGASGNLLTDNGSGACGSNADAKFASGKITLGTSGSEVGSVAFNNATSGTTTIAPTTGALGATIATLPANTGTISELNLAQTWTAQQNFNFGDFRLNGSTSGAITLNAPATAGANTITLPAGTTDFSATGGTSQVVKQTSAGGAFTVARLACSDLSDSAASCATDATNASNLSSGTVAAARGGAGTVSGIEKANGSGVVSAAVAGTDYQAPFTLSATTPGIVVSGSPGNTPSIAQTVPINLQVGTSYAILTGDNTKLIVQSNASASAYTIAAAGSTGFASGYGTNLTNNGAGAITLTPASGNILGGATLFIPKGVGTSFASDGTNYDGILGVPPYPNDSTKFLNGVGGWAVPATGGGGIGVKIATCTMASTTCNFNSLGSHDYYALKCYQITTSTSAGVLLQVNSDSTSGHYAWQVVYATTASNTVASGSGSTSDTAITLTGALATTTSLDLDISFGGIASTTLQKLFQIQMTEAKTAEWLTINGSGAFLQTGTAITSVQLLTSTGTFGSGAGKCTLYAYDS